MPRPTHCTVIHTAISETEKLERVQQAVDFMSDYDIPKELRTEVLPCNQLNLGVHLVEQSRASMTIHVGKTRAGVQRDCVTSGLEVLHTHLH